MKRSPSTRLTPVLLTVDEAREAVVRSATRTLGAASCSPEGMTSMLWGLPGGIGWNARDAMVAREHRAVLELVAAAGHAGIIAEELEGIESTTGLHEGVLRDLDIVRAQVEPSEGFSLAPRASEP